MSVLQGRCRYFMDDGGQCPNPVVKAEEFCEQHGNWLAADLEVYRAVTEHFRQDVREIWTRSNFYLLVQSGLLSVFISIFSRPSGHDRAITLVFGGLGFVIAIIWAIVAKLCIKWLRRWRAQAIEIDKVVDRHQCYSKVESLALQKPLMTPSYVTKYLPLVFCAAWVVLIGLSLF